MWKDPVVEEVRAARDEYARRFDYDIEAICRDLRAQEAESGREVVSLPPKRIPLIPPTGRPPGADGEAA
jgi:hypothetical protein